MGVWVQVGLNWVEWLLASGMSLCSVYGYDRNKGCVCVSAVGLGLVVGPS